MSSSFVSLTPLINTETGAYCHMLEIDNAKILVNCGTAPGMDTSIYDPILPQILSCDAIILTGFGIGCIGGLPYVLQNNYYNKVISSVPIKVLGRICLDEHLRAMGLESQMDTECFERISEIKYSQPTVVNNVEICAYNSGNSIGGCLYKISKGAEKIVIGLNVNHRKENHLNGMNLSGIGECSLCVFNGNHVLAENVSIAKRDEMFKSVVRDAVRRGKKVVLPVRYSRLLEVALVLNDVGRQANAKVVCLACFGKRFVERAKAMIEWAGEKVSSMFSEEKVNPFEFENIEFVAHYCDISEFDVVVVVDEYVLGGMLTTVLQRFNDENNVLLLTEPRMEDSIRRESERMKWYEFRLVERVLEKEDAKAGETFEDVTDSEPDPEGVISPWFETKYEVWCDGGDECFPSLSRRRTYDDYGEYMDRSLFVKEVLPVEEGSSSEAVEESTVEEREVAGEGIALRYSVEKVELMGVSDLSSCKMVLESLSPKKLVCIGEDGYTERFFYHTFKYMTCFEDVYVCRRKVVLSSDVSMGIVKLDKDFESLEYKMIGSDLVGGFRGVRQGDTVSCVGSGASMMIGYIDINEMRRMIIEKNMRVEQDEGGLLVEDCVWVRVTSDGVMIDGGDTGVFYAVREVVYKNVVFI